MVLQESIRRSVGAPLQVLLWWPPRHAVQAQQTDAEPSEEEQASAEGNFSSETAKILANLGAGQESGARQVSAGPGGVQARASHHRPMM